jgi:Tfp pilus assembly protein PilO
MNVNLSSNLTAASGFGPKAARNSIAQAGLLLVIIALFSFFVVMPKKAAVDSQQSQFQDLQAQESKMADTLNAVNQGITALDANKDNISHLDQAMPLKGQNTDLELLIQYLAASSGVTVGNLTISKQGDVPVAGDKTLLANPYGASRTLQTMSGTVYVIGTFDQLESFLKKLEDSGTIINVTAMSLTGGTNGALNLQLTVNSSYLAP